MATTCRGEREEGHGGRRVRERQCRKDGEEKEKEVVTGGEKRWRGKREELGVRGGKPGRSCLEGKLHC